MPLDTYSDSPDEALLVAYGNGDAAAGHALILRLAPRVLGFATRMLGDAAEAEDAVQEAMVKLWKIAPDWRQGEARVSTWLYRVVSNLCIDRMRRRRPGVGMDQIEDPADETPGVHEQMERAERDRALQDALATLPPRQREAVILRHLEGLTNPEIAQAMEIGVEAVESLTARGRRGLARALGPLREELGYG